MKKIVNESGRDWHVQLNPTLCAYLTSIHTTMGVNPYCLVYKLEAILPVEVKIPSLLVSLKGLILEEEHRISRLQELELIQEHRKNAIDHLKTYQ